MKPTENIITEESEEDSQEAHNQQNSAFRALPAPQYLGMKVGSKYQPGYKAGRLFGVPSPRLLPGNVSPEGSEDYGQRQEGEANNHSVITYAVKYLKSGVSLRAP